MSQLIYGQAAYGIVLRDDDCGVPVEWLAFGDTDQGGTTCWWNGMLNHVLRRVIPPQEAEIEIVTHCLRGHQKERERYEIPILVVKTKAAQTITSSGHSPLDLTSLLAEHAAQKAKWDGLIRAFVEGCVELGIEIQETTPHFLVYLSWDDFPTT